MTSSLRAIALLSLIAAACSFDRSEHAQACERDADCADGARCHAHFCIAAGTANGVCTQGGSQIEACYDGPDDTLDIGACIAGQRLCVESTLSACLGQVLPAPEVCNGKDDDCDGEIDDIMAGSTCDTHLQGQCAEGAVKCREGIDYCQPTRESQAETCNGADDDCDGVSDELAGSVCYPADQEGCAQDAQGSWQCSGLCATGTTICEGSEEACEGAIAPVVEACTDDMVAQDEDCDGLIDETCPCAADASRSCYAGPLGTAGHGNCAAGTQECMGTTWGPCSGQVLPSAETCDNMGEDDDCNDVEDDVAGVGLSCVALGKEGECRNGTLACSGLFGVLCAAGEASTELCDEIDQDCDGDPTNGFDFGSDETCGACDVQCSSSESCCNGSCIADDAFDRDSENCGTCGNACGQGQTCCQGECVSFTGPMQPMCACTNDCGTASCCNSSCRDLESDKDNCGACGRKCPRGTSCQDGECR